MTRLNQLSESAFLKLFMGFMVLCLLGAALCMSDRSGMLSGYGAILSSSCKPYTNYFAVGGRAATFLNMGLVGAFCLALFCAFGTVVNHVSVLAFLLSIGFSSWGIHVMNMLPGVCGVMLYCMVQKEKPSGLTNVMIFSSGVAPFISELAVRYPGHRDHITVYGLLMAAVVGVLVGFFLPSGIVRAPTIHKGLNLYSAAVPVGLSAFLLYTILYKIPGVALPPSIGGLEVVSKASVNWFFIIMCGLCLLGAKLMGGDFDEYADMIMAHRSDKGIAAGFGNRVFLMNVGVYGLFILLYYNFINASFNGVTMGLIFCMLACCCSGSHPGNVWPIMVGYVASAVLFQGWAVVTGGTFDHNIQTQTIVTGVCFANGLSPITDKYGWKWGMIASAMHYCMVTTVSTVHGGFCLYNGGLTAAMVCILLEPVMERFSSRRTGTLV
ncbi:MAG: DUF1576 domain-containing protein [Clostridia bacterium]|nr:DUF1576 domain-containing protein [Clostridia bacterium]